MHDDGTPNPHGTDPDEDYSPRAFGLAMLTTAVLLGLGIAAGYGAYRLAGAVDLFNHAIRAWLGLCLGTVGYVGGWLAVSRWRPQLLGPFSLPRTDPPRNADGDDWVLVSAQPSDEQLADLIEAYVREAGDEGLSRAQLDETLASRWHRPTESQVSGAIGALCHGFRIVCSPGDLRYRTVGPKSTQTSNGKSNAARTLLEELAADPNAEVYAVDLGQAAIAPVKRADGEDLADTIDRAMQAAVAARRAERVAARQRRFAAGWPPADGDTGVFRMAVTETSAEAEPAPGLLAPCDRDWLPAVRSLAMALSRTLTANDFRGGQSGRGNIELAAEVAGAAPQLGEETIAAYVADHTATMFGLRPGVLAEPWGEVLDDIVHPTGSAPWSAAVYRLRRGLDAEVRDADLRHCGLGGRGLSNLTRDVWEHARGLDVPTIRAFITDYLNVRMGTAPSSDHRERWAHALKGLEVHEQYREQEPRRWSGDSAPARPGPSFGVAEYPPRARKAAR